MPSNITASSVFTEPVQIPNNGEVASASDLLSTTIQPLVNRDQYLKNAVDAIVSQLTSQLAPLRQVGLWSVSGTSVADNDKLTLTEFDDPAVVFELDDNQVVLPANGTYLIAVYGTARSSATDNPLLAGFRVLRNAATLVDIYGTRYSGTAEHRVSFSGTILAGTAAGDRIAVCAISKDTSYLGKGNLTVLHGILTIHRIR